MNEIENDGMSKKKIIMMDELNSKMMARATRRRRREEDVDESGREDKARGKFRISFIKHKLILIQPKFRIENTIYHILLIYQTKD
jgi:hypothetical protein